MFICIRGIYFALIFYDFRLNFETVLIVYFFCIFRHDYIYLLITLRYINLGVNHMCLLTSYIISFCTCSIWAVTLHWLYTISYTVYNCPNTEKYRVNKIHIGRGEAEKPSPICILLNRYVSVLGQLCTVQRIYPDFATIILSQYFNIKSTV